MRRARSSPSGLTKRPAETPGDTAAGARRIADTDYDPRGDLPFEVYSKEWVNPSKKIEVGALTKVCAIIGKDVPESDARL